MEYTFSWSRTKREMYPMDYALYITLAEALKTIPDPRHARSKRNACYFAYTDCCCDGERVENQTKNQKGIVINLFRGKSASRISRADWKRLLGSISIALKITRSVCGETVGLRLTSLGPQGYSWSALTAPGAVRKVLVGLVPPGFQTPRLAVGADFLLECGEITHRDVKGKQQIRAGFSQYGFYFLAKREWRGYNDRVSPW
jgi:hypothetical protein